MTILEAAEDKDAIEHLAVLVASGNVKDMIGVDLSEEQVKRLSKKDVAKYFKDLCSVAN